MLTRREFLTRALATVPAVVLAPAAAEALAEMLAPRSVIILPPACGWPSVHAELAYVVRRAFVAKMVASIYNTSPLVSALIGNSRN